MTIAILTLKLEVEMKGFSVGVCFAFQSIIFAAYSTPTTAVPVHVPTVPSVRTVPTTTDVRYIVQVRAYQ